jgi:Protein of unknown function (DUF1573)
MKRIIITITALIIASATVNAQTKTKVKKAKEVVTKVATDVKSTLPTNVAPPPPPPPPPMPPRDMQMPGAPGMNTSAPGMAPTIPGTNGMPPTGSVPPPVPQAEVYDFDKYAKLDKMENDFGNSVKQLPEGVTTTFTITNISKEPLLIENVQASCGCTVPTWDKSPIAPGKTGSFQAKFNSQGRPGPFNKSLTISTNRGKKAVIIKGTVEQSAPVIPADAPQVPAPTPAGH